MLETNLMTGHQQIASWHLTQATARSAASALLRHYYTGTRSLYVAGAFEWRAFPARHALIEATARRQQRMGLAA